MEDFKWLEVLLFETTFFYGNDMIILLWWNGIFRISAYISMFKCTTSLEVSNLTSFQAQAMQMQHSNRKKNLERSLPDE